MENLNIAFYLVFLAEMFIKLLGMGVTQYFNQRFNTFDCFIVCISTIDFAFMLNNHSSSGGAVIALRMFRLLRVFKLAKSW